jgi:hypothetical protein
MSPSSEQVWLEAVGIAAPGLVGWQAAQDVLRGEVEYAHSELTPHAPQLLPPNERRRATPTVGARHRLCVLRRGPEHHPSHFERTHAGPAPRFTDRFPQLRAQRGGGLLEHCSRRASTFIDAVRARLLVRCRSRGSVHLGPDRRLRHAARCLRLAAAATALGKATHCLYRRYRAAAHESANGCVDSEAAVLSNQ